MYCEYCGNQLQEGTLYCEKCGKPVSAEAEKVNVVQSGNKMMKRKACPKCGKEYPDSETRCTICDIQLNSKICPCCGANYPWYGVWCANCGINLNPGTEEDSTEGNDTSETEKDATYKIKKGVGTEAEGLQIILWIYVIGCVIFGGVIGREIDEDIMIVFALIAGALSYASTIPVKIMLRLLQNVKIIADNLYYLCNKDK